jgi:hypothetical protein
MQNLSNRETLSKLQAKLIKPSLVIGRGYKYPQSVAVSYLLKEIHNEENPHAKICGAHVMTSGKPFSTIARARASAVYTQLFKGTYKLLNSASVVSDFGVMPTPVETPGYMIYVCTKVVNGFQ